MLIRGSKAVRFGAVFVAGDLAVEIADDSPDWCRWTQRLPVSEVFVLVGWDQHRRRKLLLV